MVKKQKPLKSKKRKWWLFQLISSVLCSLVLWTWWYFGLIHQQSFNSFEKAAQYGDSFGYVNSLFSGLAFAGVVAALIIQSMEYRLAAEERTEQLVIQKQISEQQAISTEVEAISTVTKLNEGLELNLERARKNYGYLEMTVKNYEFTLRLYSLMSGEDVSDKDHNRLLAAKQCLELNWHLRQAMLFATNPTGQDIHNSQQLLATYVATEQWDNTKNPTITLREFHPLLVDQVGEMRRGTIPTEPSSLRDLCRKTFDMTLQAIALLTATYFDQPLRDEPPSAFSMPRQW